MYRRFFIHVTLSSGLVMGEFRVVCRFVRTFLNYLQLNIGLDVLCNTLSMYDQRVLNGGQKAGDVMLVFPLRDITDCHVYLVEFFVRCH